MPIAASAEEGLATYYSSKLAGRKTASGEIYDPRAMTAAHRTLRFGTRVRVRRIDAQGRPRGAAVVVRINDRGPYADRRRIIDLSMAAAERLHMLRAGVVRVRVEIVGAPPPRRRKPR